MGSRRQADPGQHAGAPRQGQERGANPHAALYVEGPDKWSFVVAEGDVEVSPISTEPGDATGRELLGIFPQADAGSEAAFLAEQVAEQRVVMRLHAARLYGDIIELDATA